MVKCCGKMPHHFGTIFRQSSIIKGLVLAARSNLLPGMFTVEVGELIALREGLLLAQFYNLSVDVVEINSRLVVSFLNDSIPHVGESNFIVKDIKAMFLDVGISKCLAVSRSGNSLALKLALLAFSSVRERLWLNLIEIVTRDYK
ncbi:hypothetical protein EZV62_024761 [Acer yangbiense]|uniref:RNase H type-1 domain-containing protein n=1 Tax=Acer yangbiense TaxID=1000413 RepID=A0A5C7GXU5_9ROSI|nr:hypothetical protein EZV62_024761 [Acer yangbiense]